MSWLLRFVSRALKPEDREAVLGDLAESDASEIRAVLAVLGLIVRREFAVWKGWQPWSALIGVAGISGFYLSRIYYGLSIETFEQLTAWRRYRVHYNVGVRSFGEDIAYIVCLGAAIVCGSLLNGFVLRRFSGWVALCCYVTLFSLLSQTFRTLDGLGLWTLLFVIPTILGAAGKVPRMAWTVVIVTLLAAAMAVRHNHALEVFSGGAFPGPSWFATLLPYALVSWPVLFLRKASLRRA